MSLKLLTSSCLYILETCLFFQKKLKISLERLMFILTIIEAGRTTELGDTEQ